MALIVIDMQTSFECKQETIDAVCKEIRKAQKRKETVYNVMLKRGGAMRSKVLKTLKLGKYTNIFKADQGGGKELQEALTKAGVINRLNRANFVGIYTDLCVLDTALELAKLERWIDVRVFMNSCELYDEESAILRKEFLAKLRKLPRNLKFLD